MQENELDFIFKAIAHTERRRILFSLFEKPNQSLFEICTESFGKNGKTLSRQTISQHLDTLERAGLLEVTWQGRTKMHSIKEKPLKRSIEILFSKFNKGIE